MITELSSNHASSAQLITYRKGLEMGEVTQSHIAEQLRTGVITPTSRELEIPVVVRL